MKRLLLIAILLFPVLILALWVHYGLTHPRVQPPATKSATTNLPVENQSNHPASR